MAAKKKFYVVEEGRHPGIYTSWDDCKKEVAGFSGAVYKGFVTREEADAYLVGAEGSSPDGAAASAELYPAERDYPVAFVDGSYNLAEQVYGSGAVILLPGGGKEVLSESGSDPSLAKMRNVTGELYAVRLAVEWAVSHGHRKLLVIHDYTGIRHWAQGEWKCNNDLTRGYQAYMKEKRDVIEVTFRKVAAHTGVECNEEVDRVAKQAAGVL